jgi:hypothetical protein
MRAVNFDLPSTPRDSESGSLHSSAPKCAATLALLLLVAVLAPPLAAQTEPLGSAAQDKAPRAPQARPGSAPTLEAKPGPHRHLYYEAYYLVEAQQRHRDAIPLLREYLAKAPRGHHARDAAIALVRALQTIEAHHEAQTSRRDFAELLAGVDELLFAPTPSVLRRRLLQMSEARVAKLEAERAIARMHNDLDKVDQLERQLTRLRMEVQRLSRKLPARKPDAIDGLEIFAFRPGRSGLGRGLLRPFRRMTPKERDQTLATLRESNRGNRRILLKGPQATWAAQYYAKCEELERLVQAGKLEEADVIRVQLMREITR